MWLLILAYAAVIATVLWYRTAENDVFMYKYLALMLWGATIMFFVDHIYGYLTEGGEFFDTSIDAAILGFTLLLSVLIIWVTIILLKDPRKILRMRSS